MVSQIRLAVCQDVTGIARVHVDSWRTTYRNLLPAKFLANLSYQTREGFWKRALCESPGQSFVYVAEVENPAGNEPRQVVGFASGGRAREKDSAYQSELYAIYLLEANQHHGLGYQLFRAIVGELKRAGFQNMMLWVLVDNAPARKFYERMGGKPLHKQTVDFSGTALDEIAYGWDKLPE